MDQKVVAQSSCEAEYIAAAHTSNGMDYCNKVLVELGTPVATPSILMVDNQSAITIYQTTYTGSKMRHVATKYHKIKERVENGQLTVSYVHTSRQNADIFTKALSYETFAPLRDALVFSVSSIGGAILAAANKLAATATSSTTAGATTVSTDKLSELSASPFDKYGAIAI
jgi:hypothetical protein